MEKPNLPDSFGLSSQGQDISYVRHSSSLESVANDKRKTHKKQEKLPTIFEVYESTPISSVMNMLVLFIVYVGVILTVSIEIRNSEAIFTRTERGFARSEVMQDNISVENRVAYGDLILPDNKFVTGITDQTVAQDSSGSTTPSNVLGATTSTESEQVGQVREDNTIAEQTNQVTESNTQKFDDANSLLEKALSGEVQKLISELELKLPKISSDKNQLVTFKSGVSVKLKINDGAEQAIASPHKLNITKYGQYNLKFLFNNNVIEIPYFLIPETPKVDPLTSKNINNNGIVTITGKAVPNSAVNIIVSSEMQTGMTEANSEGIWSIVLRKALPNGSHTVLAQTIVDGYRSSFTEPMVFTVKNSDSVETLPETSSIGFELSTATVLVALGALIIGIILTSIWMRLFNTDNASLMLSTEERLPVTEIPLELNPTVEKNPYVEKVAGVVEESKAPIKLPDHPQKVSKGEFLEKFSAFDDISKPAETPKLDGSSKVDKRTSRTKSNIDISLL